MPVNNKLMVRTAHPTLILVFQVHISLQKVCYLNNIASNASLMLAYSEAGKTGAPPA